MSCGKCGKSKGFCPMSFGLALGLTCALGVLVWTAWTMFGMSAMTMGHMMPPADFSSAWVMAGLCFVKGFIAGLVFALIYNLIRCCCKARCCKKVDGAGGCGCGCPSCTCKTGKE